MTTTGVPFDDIRSLLSHLPAPDEDAAAAARACVRGGENDGSLGELEELAVWLARWSGRGQPRVMRPLVALFAGTHGVSRRLGHADATRAAMRRVERVAAGGAPVSRLCAAGDLGLKVFDLALDVPTGDITESAAFEERDCAATVAFGMEAVAGGTDLLCIGEVAGDGDVAAEAVLVTSCGEKGMQRGEDRTMRDSIDRALALHRRHLADPLEALRRLGGREIAAACGAILAARTERIPVILDGLAPAAAAAVLNAVHEGAAAHCLLAAAADGRQRAAAEHVGLPVFADFAIRAGEGVAAALAAGVARTAAQLAQQADTVTPNA